MAGISFGFRLLGRLALSKVLSPETVNTPLSQGIRKITLFVHRETTKATPVDTGRLRASITQEISPFQGIVGTNVNYASFVEYGTKKMEARYVESGWRVYGLGMFGYAMKLLQSKIGEFIKNIGHGIEVKFGQ